MSRDLERLLAAAREEGRQEERRRAEAPPPAASDLERARNILRGWWECDDPRALSEIVGLALAAARAEGRDEGDAEIKRLNEWADDFSNAQLKERRLCEERIREITAERDAARAEAIEPWRAKLAEQCGKTLAARAAIETETHDAYCVGWDNAVKALRDRLEYVYQPTYWADWLASNKPKPTRKGEP